MKRDTVGKISSDLIIKQNEDTHCAEEQMREQLSDYDRNLFERVELAKRECFNDFYIIVITKKERLMPNVIRNYFTHRLSCPTPEYDQIVYKYNRKDEVIDFLWVIPSKDTCQTMRDNALNVPQVERELLNFVLDFYDGTLLKISKKLNGEEADSPLLIT